MRPHHLALALLLVSLSGPIPVRAGVRAIALQGDPAPGVPAATFASFPLTSASAFAMPVICDSTGHVTFFATTSTGVSGLWSDVTGTLAPVVLVGDDLPGLGGPDTLLFIGNFLMSDRGQVVFYGITKHGATTWGLWYWDTTGLTLAAHDGDTAPWLGGPATFDLSSPNFTAGNGFSTAGPLALNGQGRLAVRATGRSLATSHIAVWTFDPPPVVNRFVCEQAGFTPGIASFLSLGTLSLNADSYFAQQNSWYPGNSTANNGIWEGACALMGSVLTDGDLAPPVGSIPHTANVLQDGANLPPDINASRAVAFTSWLQNGGVTSSNNTVVWLHDTGGFHVVCRMGDTTPELAPGETLTPNTSGGGAPSDMPQLLSDQGTIVFDVTIPPSNAPAVMLYHPDGTLHVLARNGAAAPGFTSRFFTIYFNSAGGTGLSMNHAGQVLIQTSVRDSTYNQSRNAAFTTDATGTLTPIVVDQNTYTVRTGLTGTLLDFGISSLPLPSNGTDGRWHNFSNTGQYVFRATFQPNGGSQEAGVFAAGGPDLSYVGVTPREPSATRLDPIAPNPASGTVRIAFELAHPGAVRLEVLDLAGRRVRVLENRALDPGPHEVHWRGDDDGGRPLARGVYFVRLRAPGSDLSQRMVLLR
jgi:FlgD Ig-like domain